jgi:hypothetical protein
MRQELTASCDSPWTDPGQNFSDGAPEEAAIDIYCTIQCAMYNVHILEKPGSLQIGLDLPSLPGTSTFLFGKLAILGRSKLYLLQLKNDSRRLILQWKV